MKVSVSKGKILELKEVEVSFKRMKVLVSKGKILELKEVEVSFYEPYVFGK